MHGWNCRDLFPGNVRAFRVYYGGIFKTVSSLFCSHCLIHNSFFPIMSSRKPLCSFLPRGWHCAVGVILPEIMWRKHGGAENDFKRSVFGCRWMKRPAVWIPFIITGFRGLTPSLQGPIFSLSSLNLATDCEWLINIKNQTELKEDHFFKFRRRWQTYGSRVFFILSDFFAGKVESDGSLPP